VEDPTHNAAGSSMPSTQVGSGLGFIASTGPHQQHGNMLISSTNGNVRSLQNSIKMRGTQNQLQGLTPVLKQSSKFQESVLQRNNSQDFNQAIVNA
jgi:hypothetical protein